MKGVGRNVARRARRGATAVWVGVCFALAAGLSSPLALQAQPAPATAPPRSAAPAESGVGWRELTPQQKEDLRPLEREWTTIDPQQKRKWLELTGRMPKMSADERGRIQARMIDWAKLTPEQRSQARLHFQEAKRVPRPDRQARWDAYQSLPTEEKQQLAKRAALAASAARRSSAARYRTAGDLPQAKSNTVAPPEVATRPTPVAPTLVQARPGATTTSIARVPSPPVHQQAGMPKIAATPEFVYKSTLLPRRGPQAAVGSQGAASAATR